MGSSEIEGQSARVAASEQGRERVSNSCLESVSEKIMNSDEHFDRPFSFMPVKEITSTTIRNQKL
jgi:hypothetical protein